MATKLQTYKFVNPGVVKSIKTPEVISARKTLVAQNRLGASVSSLGKTVVDLEKITTLRAKAAVKLDIAERRAKRRGQDMAAEEVQEGQLSAYFKDQKKKVKRFKPGSGLMKIFKGIFGWVGPLLSPFVQLATKIFALAIVKEMLEWASNEENIIKLETFLMKTDYVFRKIYGFGEFLIKDNIVAGFESLFGSDETLLGRLKGLGQIILGVTGLKYLLNPFSLMTDIIGLIELLTGNRGRTGSGGPRSGGNTGGGGRPSGYTPRTDARGNQVAGRGRQYRTNLNRVVKPGTTPQGLTIPKKPSRLAGFKANLQTGTANLPGVSPGAQRALFNAPGKLTNVASKAFAVSKNFLRRIPVVGALLTALYTFLETGNLEKSLFVGAGAALGGALGSFIPIPVLGTLMGEILGGYIGDLFYIGLRGGGMEALGQKLKEDFNKLLQTGKLAAEWAKDGFDRFMRGAPKIKILPDWIPLIGGAEVLDPSKVIAYATWEGNGFLRAFFSRDPMTEAERKKLEIEGARLQGQAKDIATSKMYFQTGVGYFSSETHRFLGKTKEEAEATLAARSGYSGAQPGNYHYHDQNGHFEIGGKLPQFFFGGLFKGIKKVVSGIGKAVSGVFNAVASVASNPIVSTIASFIPGANIIVPAINAISALSKGDFLGAGLNALGGIANFSAIGSTARSMVNTPDWLLNLRMSKFGMGLSNAYQGAVKFVGNLGGKFANAFGGIIDSRIGKIGMKILAGNTGGAIGEIVGMMPGVAGGLEGFGKFLEENKLQGILGAVPGMGGLMKRIPNIGAIPGMESILGVGDKKFSAFNAMGNIADKVGMKGVYQAILSGAQSGDYIQGLAELAPELGVDPRILGVLNKGKALLQSNKFNAEYAMQTAIEFLPVPLIVEKLVPAPTPVPINSGDTYVVAPSSTQQER